MNHIASLARAVLSRLKPAKEPTERRFPSRILRHVPGECTYCRKILYVAEMKVADIKGYTTFKIGTVEEVLTSECKQHQELLYMYREELELNERAGQLWMVRRYFDFQSIFHVIREGGQFPYYTDSTPDMDILGGDGLGVELDPSWINEKAVIGWYENCLREHGDKCSTPKYLDLLPRSKPTYFIDVEDNCVVEAPWQASYAALSYIWGQTAMLRSTKANISRLQEKGALMDRETLQNVPRTVQHAMYLTRKLPGVRYLWVDALCILQDDDAMIGMHLPQMGSIYANASVVLTGMDGTDANYGLRGLKSAPIAQPRQMQQEIIPFGKKKFVIRHGNGRAAKIRAATKPIEQSIASYHARGWTFQEHFFSRRCICFENDSVWFQCCSSANFEDRSISGQPDDQRDWILDVGYPSITVLSRVIHDFNQRHLSFPQDCLLAFSGVTPCYAKVFTGGFVCGLPEMFIDAMLLWQPGGNLVRRVPQVNKNKSLDQNTGFCLPSWSWVGWQGELDLAGWEVANEFVAACSGWIGLSKCQIRKGTTWYTSANGDGSERRKLDSLWLDWRKRYMDPNVKLPSGWIKWRKRKDEVLTSSDAPDGFGKYVYAAKKNSVPTFWYPLPLDDPQGVPRVDADQPYLCAKVDTAHAFFLGDVSIVPASHEKDGEIARISLSDAEGRWIGMLRLPSLDYLNTNGLEARKETDFVQLIAISEGFVPNGMEGRWGPAWSYVDEYNLEERPRDGMNYEFVNVLWISWNGGVARREALGRVEKKRWKELGPEPLDVVLG